MATHSSILAWRTWWSTVHGAAKESDTTEQLTHKEAFRVWVGLEGTPETCS